MSAGIALADDNLSDISAAESGEGALEAAAVSQTADPALSEENDDLLEAYLEVSLGVSHDPMYSAMGVGRKLSGANRTAYTALKKKVSQVAAGKLTSTVFTFSAADMGLEESYNAASLQKATGISVSSLGTIANDGTMTLSSGASAAISALVPDLNKVVTALLFDCPYEFFWYNKTASGACQSSTGYSGSGRNGKLETISITKLVYSFQVAEEYAASTWQVDSSKIAAIQTSIKNINSIVAQNASLKDYEKVTAYKNTICDLVSYNKAAAGNSSTPYGNPWQLIWVFDGDPSTNVVCEGYSKAFQYLCDLSSFRSSNVSSRLVSGIMQGGTGAGGHMWNVITMNDGVNYLVDVTNCDTGTVGAPDKLFLAGGTGNGSADYTVSKVSYQYDDDTRESYSKAELTISESGYVISEEGQDAEPQPGTDSTDLSEAAIASISAKTYTGKKITPEPEVSLNGEKLVKDTDYTLSYRNNLNVGTAKVTVTGTGSYTGSQTVSFKIKAKSVTPKITLSAESFTYNGKIQKPKVSVKDGKTKLTKNTDYTVTYAKGCKKVGSYAVTVTLQGNYSGSGEKTFTINPKGTSLSRLTSASKTFTAKWKKQATQTTGYQIRYSTSKNFKSAKTVTVKNNKTTSQKIKKLKGKTTYYVQIRTYKTVGKKKYYSDWSKTKTVTTAK